MEQDYKARAEEAKVNKMGIQIAECVDFNRGPGGLKWDNESYDPTPLTFGQHRYRDNAAPPVAGLMVQMVIENRDSPEPEVRPFLIVQVLDASVGLVNGMLFMANSDIRAGEPGILGGGMSQAIRSAGFEVPNAVRGVFWLDRVRFHPVGLPRQQTTKVEKRIPMLNVPGETEYMGDTFETVDEPLWESPGVPLLEATWRWCQ